MMVRSTKLGWTVVMLALTVAFANASVAQTTTTMNTRDFEVISVDGNKLVVRDQQGTQELTVPDDFRFTVDGKKMAVSDLKPGMKGMATITTTTKVTPVVVTEVREAQVLRASDVSVTVRNTDGTTRKFSQGQLDTSGIEVYRDGKPIRVADLRRGDKLTATIVTTAEPVVLTEKEVQATLDEANAAAPTTMAANATTAPPATMAAAPAAAPATAVVSADQSSAVAGSPPAEPSGSRTMWYVVIALLVIVGMFLFARRRKAS